MINLYRPTIKRKDLEYVLDCMMHDKIDYGDFAKIFEKKLKDRTKIKNVVVVNSLFNAIILILEAMEIKEGDEVIIPSFTPQVYLNAVLFKNAVPKIVDMEKDSLKPSIDNIKKVLSNKTKAIMIKYHFGYGFNIQEYIDIYPNIIEDISSLVGAKFNDENIGTKGKYAIADFSSKSIITTGEGAAIFSNSKKDYNIINSLLEIDYNLDNENKYIPRIACLMPDLNAAMGVSQDESLNHRLNLRQKIGSFYEDSVKRSHGTKMIYDESTDRYYSDFPILCKSSLKEIIKYFKKNKIDAARPYEYLLHHYLKLDKKDFANSEYLYLNLLLIPIYSSLRKKDVDLIAKIIASII